jgi:hypothetical protein
MSYKSFNIQRTSDIGKIATEIFNNNFHPGNAEMEYVRQIIPQYKLMLVSKFMALYGFPTVEHDFDSSNCVVEVHHSEQNHRSELLIHQESDGDFLDSQTLCVYLKNTFSGGGLNIYFSIYRILLKIVLLLKSLYQFLLLLNNFRLSFE